MDLRRTALEQMWGFSVEAELIENSDRQDELCCYVSRVEDKSVAMQNGEYLALICMFGNGSYYIEYNFMEYIIYKLII